jgi:hypothetical protein
MTLTCVFSTGSAECLLRGVPEDPPLPEEAGQLVRPLAHAQARGWGWVSRHVWETGTGSTVGRDEE